MTMLGKILIPLENWIRKQQFQPNVAGIFVNPTYILRKPLFGAIKNHSLSVSGKILDYGCGTGPYRSLFQNCEYHGIDISIDQESSNIRKFDGEKIPFEDTFFDFVLCSEVIEHVPDEQLMLNEIKRVLKPKGYLIITVPFLWEEHGHPYDFRRFTELGINTLIHNQGFKVLSSNRTTRATASVFQLISSRLYNRLHIKNFYLNVLMIMIIFAPYTLLATIVSGIFPGSKKLYLNTVLLAQKDD